jgi:hypothetical protein
MSTGSGSSAQQAAGGCGWRVDVGQGIQCQGQMNTTVDEDTARAQVVKVPERLLQNRRWRLPVLKRRKWRSKKVLWVNLSAITLHDECSVELGKRAWLVDALLWMSAFGTPATVRLAAVCGGEVCEIHGGLHAELLTALVRCRLRCACDGDDAAVLGPCRNCVMACAYTSFSVPLASLAFHLCVSFSPLPVFVAIHRWIRSRPCWWCMICRA